MDKKKEATYTDSIIALSFIVIFVFGGYLLFDLSVEIMLVASAVGAGLLALKMGYSWSELEKSISKRLQSVTPAILIIWTIGAIISTFIFSGSIPMFVYYGIQLVSPQFIYVSAFVICIIFSIITGSSYASAGTAGIALMSIASGLDIPLHITAAAIICGSIFGDKLSPLSETTNLASSTTGVNIYEHIKSMTWTTFPAAIITLVFFFIVGLNHKTYKSIDIGKIDFIKDLDNIFTWNPILLIPFIIILLGAIFKKPPIPVMLFSSFIAVLIGVAYQGFSLDDGVTAALSGFDPAAIVPEGAMDQISEETITLLERGGITSMISVVLIIYCGYSYTAIISEAGFLDKAISPLTKKVKNRGPLMVTTLFTEFLIYVFSGTSYTGAVLIPDMFKKPFLRAGMAAKTLSRSIEDVGTIMAPLVPWGQSGAFYISTLGVFVFGSEGYGTWSIMTYITPVIAIILAYTGIGIYKLNSQEKKEAIEQYDQYTS